MQIDAGLHQRGCGQASAVVSLLAACFLHVLLVWICWCRREVTSFLQGPSRASKRWRPEAGRKGGTRRRELCAEWKKGRRNRERARRKLYLRAWLSEKKRDQIIEVFLQRTTSPAPALQRLPGLLHCK